MNGMNGLREGTYCLALLLLFLLGPGVPGTAAQEEAPVDLLFQQARQEAFAENYAEARRLCRTILEQAPDYHDVRVLLARTWAWEGDYRQARKELQLVLDDNPRYEDALRARGDVELWSKNFGAAVSVMEEALRYHPLETDFLLRKIRAHLSLGENRQASVALARLERVNPSHEALPELRRQAANRILRNTVGASYGYEGWSDIFGRIHSAGLLLRRKTDLGTVIGRLSYMDRPGRTGLQGRFTAYPVISQGVYGYLDYGYSGSGLFPKHRMGAELFHGLPWSLEGSLGGRYLRFSDASSVTMITGSLSRYLGNYYLSLRAFFTLHSAGTSRALTVTLRRYLANPDHYLWLTGTWGVSPRERTYQQVNADVFLLKSRGIAGGIRMALGRGVTLKASGEYDHRELLFRPGDFTGLITISAGLEVHF